MKVRYQVARTWETEDDDFEEVLAQVADVEGLFADAQLPERQDLVLRGCPPELATLSGHLVVEVLDDTMSVEWWDLVDTVVESVLPDGDLVVSAALCLQDWEPDEVGQRRYRIHHRSTLVGWCRDVEGLPESPEYPPLPAVTLIGCDNLERLRSDRPRHDYACWEGLRALDDNGRVMATVPLDLEITEVRPSMVGDGLFDVVLLASDDGHPLYQDDRPRAAARAVWDLWRQGIPREPNLWAHLDTESRSVWSHLTYEAHETRTEDREGGTYHLDGRYVTDYQGLHLALAEAFVGPGNYFGRSFDAFKDCVHHGWGVVGKGSTLVWHNAEVAHEAIRDSFVQYVQMMREYGVTVEVDSTLDGLVDLDRRTALTSLVGRWQAGWAKATGYSCTRAFRCWQVEIGLSYKQIERILADDDPYDLDWLASQLVKSPRAEWLTVPTNSPVSVTETLQRHGLELRPAKTFLRRTLADHPMAPVPDGYEVTITHGDVIEVEVTQDGRWAASGSIAVVGADAVPHRVDCRGRGPGSVVMGALVREAISAGATTGLVTVKEDDLHLFLELGWEKVADVVIAMNDAWRKDMRRTVALGSLVRRWQKGREAAEQLPAAHESLRALRVRLDRPGRKADVLVTEDVVGHVHLVSAAETESWQDTWVVIATHSPDKMAVRALEYGLHVRPRETLMTRDLAGHPAPEPREGYLLTVARTHVIEARITHDGTEVARGRMAVVGQDAVAFDVSTESAHRRRGLGKAVMGALVREALAEGATAGLVFSSELGKLLYRSLGWQDEAGIVIAHRR